MSTLPSNLKTTQKCPQGHSVIQVIELTHTKPFTFRKFLFKKIFTKANEENLQLVPSDRLVNTLVGLLRHVRHAGNVNLFIRRVLNMRKMLIMHSAQDIRPINQYSQIMRMKQVLSLYL